MTIDGAPGSTRGRSDHGALSGLLGDLRFRRLRIDVLLGQSQTGFVVARVALVTHLFEVTIGIHDGVLGGATRSQTAGKKNRQQKQTLQKTDSRPAAAIKPRNVVAMGFYGQTRTSNMGAMLATSSAQIRDLGNRHALAARLSALCLCSLLTACSASSGPGSGPASPAPGSAPAGSSNSAASSAAPTWRYGDWPEAVGETALQEAVRDAEENPDSFDAELRLCEARASYSAWFEAAAACQRAAVLRDDDPAVHMRLVIIYWHLRYYDYCRDSAQKAANLLPYDAETCFRLGNAHRKLGEKDEAARELGKAVELAPSRLVYYPELVRSLMDLDHLADASRVIQRAIDQAPSDEKLLALRKEVDTTTSQRLATFERLIIQEPENPATYAYLAQTLAGLGFHERAIEEFNRALSKMGPTGSGTPPIERLRAEVYYNRGIAQRSLGQDKLAIQDLELSASLERELEARAFYTIGLIHLENNDANGAVKALEASVAKEPSVPENRLELARAYERAGRSADAERMRKTAEALQKTDEP